MREIRGKLLGSGNGDLMSEVMLMVIEIVFIHRTKQENRGNGDLMSKVLWVVIEVVFIYRKKQEYKLIWKRDKLTGRQWVVYSLDSSPECDGLVSG